MMGVRCPAWDLARADVQHLSGLPSLQGQAWQEHWVSETGARAFRVTCQTPGRFAVAGGWGGQQCRCLESSPARLACGLGLT